MRRRLWLSVAMLAVGASLLVAASLASAAGNGPALKKGGNFKAAFVGTSTSMDPQVGYVTTTWTLEYSTSARLYRYKDASGPAGAQLVPEVASGFTVSNGGKVYTFTLRNNFKFSDGTKVTCANFDYAVDRAANHTLQSPAAGFITDPAGTFIIGADKTNAGANNHVSGASCHGNKFVIHLKKADGTFMAKITTPFFQATSKKVPLTKEVVNVNSIKDMPTAGPYAFSLVKPDVSTQIVQNPYWKPGPASTGHDRPRNLAAYTITWNVNQDTAYLQTINNEYDEGPLPPADVQTVARKFGVNKSRFWVKPLVCTGYIAMHWDQGIFHNNQNLRQAFNYAFARKDYVDQVGLYGGSPWDHILPPGMPGYFTQVIYPRAAPNLTKAKALAKNHMGDGNINLWYRSSGTVNPNQAQIVKRDLVRLGFSAGNIHLKGFPGADLYDAMGVKGANFDMGTSTGWCQDYPDPYDFINVLLNGSFIQNDHNNNLAYFNDTKWNAKENAAAKLTGSARISAYTALDKGITSGPAPWAASRTYNNRYLFSNRVDSRSLVYQGVYTDFDIDALALK